MAAGVRWQKVDTEWPLRQLVEIKVERSLSQCLAMRSYANRDHIAAD